MATGELVLNAEWLRMLRAQMLQELGGGKRCFTEKEIADALDRAIAWALIGFIRP